MIFVNLVYVGLKQHLSISFQFADDIFVVAKCQNIFMKNIFWSAPTMVWREQREVADLPSPWLEGSKENLLICPHQVWEEAKKIIDLPSPCFGGAKKICWSAPTMVGKEQRKFADLPPPWLGRSKENFLIFSQDVWEGAEKIYNSSRFRIANLSFSSAASTSNT